jgi:hypothetical protein
MSVREQLQRVATRLGLAVPLENLGLPTGPERGR